jgi:DNA-binding transcriptional LysR family regulator
MEIFNAVAQAGQFTRAAKALRLSKSAVSHAVNDLENYLQVQLITRSNRGLQLTEAGRGYHRQCQAILAKIEDLEDDTRKTQEIIRGRIRLTVPAVYGANRIVPIVAKFSDTYPDIDIEMDMSDGVIDMVEQDFDLAIRIGQLVDNNLIVRKLGTMKSVLCASPDFISRNGDIKAIEDLADVNCIRYVRTPTWSLIKSGRTHNFVPRGAITANGGNAIVQFAITGSGVAFIPDFICSQGLADGRLVRLLPEYEGRSLNISAVLPPHRHRPLRVRRLLDFIVDNFSHMEALS